MSEQNNNADQHAKDSNQGFAAKFGKKKTFSSTQVDKNKVDEKIESKIDNVSEEQKSKKAVDPQKRALAQYIYLVRGVDAGRNAWYYVLVERLKVQLFLKALNDDIIHLEKYGKILYSAYGDEPPANVTQAIKDEYGIS
jgi:hypothetical protein